MTGVGRRVTPECTGFAPSKTVISCHTSDNARPVGQRLIDAGPSSLALALNSSMQVSFLIISLSLSLSLSLSESRNWCSTCCSTTVHLEVRGRARACFHEIGPVRVAVEQFCSVPS
jgi:hypothetical protein